MLTSEECDTIRAMPLSFNNMLRFVENKGREDYLKFFKDILAYRKNLTGQYLLDYLEDCSKELKSELDKLEATKGDLTAK